MKIGMDIGTSTSSVCVDVDGEKHLIKCGTGAGSTERHIPSAIYLKEDGTLLIGQAAEQNRMRNPQRFVKSFKRELGQKIPLRLGEKDFLPEQLIEHLISHLKACAEKSEMTSDEKITEATICHPANFSQYKKDLLIKAAVNAGIDNVELMDEPTAAAHYYYYKDKIQTGETLLIYDLGGGTFDISLMKKTDDGLELLTRPLGIEKCGGDDFNYAIYEYISNDEATNLEQIKSMFTDKNMLNMFENNLEDGCIKAKELLSCDDTASIFLTMASVEITRSVFEGLIKEYVDETMAKVSEAISNAGMNPSDIDKVLLVGGSCRIPYIKKRLTELVGDKVVDDVDPDLAVCLGSVETPSVGDITYKKEKELSQTPDGQNILGCSYYEGKNGKKQDYNMATYWFKLASEQGNPDAQYMLGICYRNGLGVTKNILEAAKWIEKSANNGNLKSQLIAGFLYQSGEIKKDDNKSIEFYKKAQDQGSIEALFELGNVYSHFNYVESLKWYNKAAARGYKGAREKTVAMQRAIAEQQRRDREEAMRARAEQERREKLNRPRPSLRKFFMTLLVIGSLILTIGLLVDEFSFEMFLGAAVINIVVIIIAKKNWY